MFYLNLNHKYTGCLNAHGDIIFPILDRIAELDRKKVEWILGFFPNSILVMDIDESNEYSRLHQMVLSAIEKPSLKQI